MSLWINQFKSEGSSVPPVLRVKTLEYLLTCDNIDRKVERTVGSGPPPPPTKRRRSDIIAAYTHGGGG